MVVDLLKVMNTYYQTINLSASYFVSLLTPDNTKVQILFVTANYFLKYFSLLL